MNERGLIHETHDGIASIHPLSEIPPDNQAGYAHPPDYQQEAKAKRPGLLRRGAALLATTALLATGCASSSDNEESGNGGGGNDVEHRLSWEEWRQLQPTIPHCPNGVRLENTQDGRIVSPLIESEAQNGHDNFSTFVHVRGDSDNWEWYTASGSEASITIPHATWDRLRDNGGYIDVYATNGPVPGPDGRQGDGSGNALLDYYAESHGYDPNDLTDEQIMETFEAMEDMHALCQQYMFIDGEATETITPDNYYDYNNPRPERHPATDTPGSGGGETTHNYDPSELEEWRATAPAIDCIGGLDNYSVYTSPDNESLVLLYPEMGEQPISNQAVATVGTVVWQRSDDPHDVAIWSSLRAVENQQDPAPAWIPGAVLEQAHHEVRPGGEVIVSVWMAPVPDLTHFPDNGKNGAYDGPGNTPLLFLENVSGSKTRLCYEGFHSFTATGDHDLIEARSSEEYDND